MRQFAIFVFFIILSLNINAETDTLIYNTGRYKWQLDRIIQGEFTGQAVSATEITSNYVSPQKITNRNSWKLKNDISFYPQYETPYLLEKAIYNMGLDEMLKAVEPNLTFRTGELWGGVWTRDMSYSIILSMAYMQPTIAKNCLLLKINQLGKIVQDTGTGGSWPVSTDRMIWVTAAWEIYKVTGDLNWIKTIYPVVKRSVDDDIANIYDLETGLVMGESSFIDWREQSYPTWMQPADIYKSKCLGTNALHYQALWILGRMGEILEYTSDAKIYNEKAQILKESINKYFWMPEKGYYAQYLYGRNADVLSPRSETLGESLCILFDIASPEQQQRIIEQMPIVPFGPTIFYPQIKDIPPYHNNGIWPFVSAYWTLSAAKVENGNAVLHGIGSIYRSAALFATNKENFVAQDGDWGGTEMNSSVMLWSISGNLSIVHRVLFGINYDENHLIFKPLIPYSMRGKRKLTNFKYRNAIVNIETEGYGNEIKSFTLDGNTSEPIFPANLTGIHNIKIVLVDNSAKNKPLNIVENKFALSTPVSIVDNDVLIWTPVEDAIAYQLLKNGKELAIQKNTIKKLKIGDEGEYQVIAIAKDRERSSFSSEPVLWNHKYTTIFDLKRVKISKKENRKIEYTIKVDEESNYAIDWLYANGNGPVPQTNKCAIRTILVDDKALGAIVFPQRGQDNWDDLGWTNSIKVRLVPGEHKLGLIFNSESENMNIDINEAIIYKLRLIKQN